MVLRFCSSSSIRAGALGAVMQRWQLVRSLHSIQCSAVSIVSSLHLHFATVDGGPVQRQRPEGTGQGGVSSRRRRITRPEINIVPSSSSGRSEADETFVIEFTVLVVDESASRDVAKLAEHTHQSRLVRSKEQLCTVSVHVRRLEFLLK